MSDNGTSIIVNTTATSYNNSCVTDEFPGVFHRTIDFAQKCASPFETPILNRRMFRQH